MLGIVISDDDSYTLDISANLINKSIAAHRLPAEIICVSTNFNEIDRFLNNNRGIYLYFLDIDFGRQKLNGLDLARLIKKKEPLSKIVFVTSHTDIGMQVLKSGVEPFGFIEKCFHQNKMVAEYHKYIELALSSPHLSPPVNANAAVNPVRVPVGFDEYIDLDPRHILYVEAVKTMSHFVCYHSLDGSTVSVRDTIENVLANLGGRFIKSHRAVIINTTYVVGVEDGLVRFSNGESAACSFRLKNEVMKRCLKP